MQLSNSAIVRLGAQRAKGFEDACMIARTKRSELLGKASDAILTSDALSCRVLS